MRSSEGSAVEGDESVEGWFGEERAGMLESEQEAEEEGCRRKGVTCASVIQSSRERNVVNNLSMQRGPY